jgi:cytochrome P450
MLLPPEMRANPYPMYAAMRENQPVMFVDPPGLWTVFKYDDVKTVLSDHARFSSAFGGSASAAMGAATGGGVLENSGSMITSDPPRHTKLRGLISRAFTPATVSAMEPRITAIAHELLDQVVAAGEMDMVRDFTYPLPVIVIAEMLGIPAEDRDRFKHWSDEVVASADVILGGAVDADRRAHAEMAEYFRGVIAYRREHPGSDLISSLLAAEIEGEQLTEKEVLDFCWLLLVAGNETTTNLIGNAVLTLLEEPEALARLRADRSLVPSALEEVLRYRSPVQAMFRVAREDVALSGQSVKAGSMVIALIGSANRDEERFPDADRFDITRSPNPHIAFGHGIHFCLGAPLARLEAKVALNAILDRLDDLQRANDDPLEPAKGLIVHGVMSLPIRFRPGLAVHA